MRKGLCWALMLALLLTGAGWAAAEDTLYYDFFRSLEGQISFTLPSVPQTFLEADLVWEQADQPASALGWRDKVQLMGQTAMDGEFQVHIADLSPTLDSFRASHPDASEGELQANAMIQLAWFYIRLYDGQFTAEPVLRKIAVEDRTFTEITFEYAYPDAEGVAYAGRGIMDGNHAVVMMGTKDEEMESLLAEMRVVTLAEAETFRARQGETVTLGRMQIAFPAPVDRQDTGYSLFYDAFTPDYTYLSAEYMPVDFSTMLRGHTAEEFLQGTAQAAAEGYQSEGVLDTYTIEAVADGVYRVDAFGPLSDLGEYGAARDHVHMYVTMTGVYTVNSVDNEVGNAFLASIRFDQENE